MFLLQGAGVHLHRIGKIIVEAQNTTHDTMLYEGQASGEKTVNWIQNNGFTLNQGQTAVENAGIGEVNYVFDKIDVRMR